MPKPSPYRLKFSPFTGDAEVDQAALLQACEHWACSCQDGLAALLDGARNHITATYFMLESMKKHVDAGVNYTIKLLESQSPP